MQRTRVKFCGITREEDMRQAVSLGVDAVGLVFVPESPRVVNVQQACMLIDHCGPFVTRIGLFMDQDAGTINDIISHVPLDMLQFHGKEDEQFCTSFGLPYVKTVAMGGEYAQIAENDYATASALLLDSNELGKPGGSGETFDWQKVPQISRPIVVAGGLHPDNVAKAIKQLSPYAVDVSSGIEVDKGIKDINKMRDFITSVRMADEC